MFKKTESFTIKKTKGLKNCGGTCYFNSFLQLFFNIEEIQEYFENYKTSYYENVE